MISDVLSGARSWGIEQGDVRQVLAEMPAESVQTVVTSPPYWGLRDYSVEGQIGLERTPEQYVQTMVDVFRGVRRVLRSDGTLWLNLGDSYASVGKGGEWDVARTRGKNGRVSYAAQPNRGDLPGLKPKDLCMIPARVALALQADGWWLRSVIIWAKPNPMPESVTDRPTTAHEYMYLLAKSERYFYDAQAIAEPVVAGYNGSTFTNGKTAAPHLNIGQGPRNEDATGRNKRTVWNVATSPFSGAHFATFPPKLIEPCILAGTSERGCCPECGAPWERVVERIPGAAGESVARPKGRSAAEAGQGGHGTASSTLSISGKGGGWQGRGTKIEAKGWQPTCKHAHEPVPCVVLDPFAGAGTTLMVALRHGRRAVGIELSPEYIRMAEGRIVGDAPLFNMIDVEEGIA